MHGTNVKKFTFQFGILKDTFKWKNNVVFRLVVKVTSTNYVFKHTVPAEAADHLSQIISHLLVFCC